MISRSDCVSEPLPDAHPQPFCTRVPFSVSLCVARFFTAAVWCVPALPLRVPWLVHSLINHFRENE